MGVPGRTKFLKGCCTYLWQLVGLGQRSASLEINYEEVQDALTPVGNMSKSEAMSLSQVTCVRIIMSFECASKCQPPQNSTCFYVWVGRLYNFIVLHFVL